MGVFIVDPYCFGAHIMAPGHWALTRAAFGKIALFCSGDWCLYARRLLETYLHEFLADGVPDVPKSSK